MTMHTMVDIETLDTAHTALVLSIGLVNFDPYTINTWDELYPTSTTIYLDVNDQLDRTISADTVIWWMSQSDEAKLCFTNTPRFSVKNAKQTFSTITAASEALWGNGMNFDNAILRNLWSGDLGFGFGQDRDMRTLKDLVKALRPNTKGPHQPTSFVKHNARHDALFQTMQVQHWVQALSRPTKKALEIFS